MQHRTRTNQELERAEQRNNDGHDESSLFGTASNLDRHKVYSVSGSHSQRDAQDEPPQRRLTARRGFARETRRRYQLSVLHHCEVELAETNGIRAACTTPGMVLRYDKIGRISGR